MQETWIGRQPIFDRALTTHAYELLFRSPYVARPTDIAGEIATAQVIVSALADIGLDRVVGSLPAFVNVTRDFVVGGQPLPLPPERVVLEFLETIEGDRDVLVGVERLRDEGFRIALDDVRDLRPALIPLMRRADIIKVDCLGLTPEEIAEIVRKLRPFPGRLLAEKVETAAEVQLCMELGFELFQGYFLERPSVIKSQTLSPSRTQLLRLIAELQEPEVTFEQVEEIVRLDLALSLKLVSCANSATYGVERRIENVRDAVILLGLLQTRNLVTLILLSRIDGKPPELLQQAMTRARMCENLATRRSKPDPRAAFMVGMFSLLDALLDQPMQTILEGLPLSAPTKDALSERRGELGGLLEAVVSCERGEWDVVEQHLGTEEPLRACFVDAIEWASEIRRNLSA
ncbi:MAG: HDOD domain-containing protein [Planctomycetes bacterium]|nr:HDOD domain-containing protein [Planctomycetota bacterium]